MTSLQNEIKEVLASIHNLTCWGIASCTVGSTLSIDFGGRLLERLVYRRRKIVRDCEVGEFHILVWCSWRLDIGDRPVCSSESTEEQIENGVNQLVGQTLTKIEIVSPVWDANIHFTSDLVLRIFCDYVEECGPKTNWDIAYRDTSYFFGRGNEIEKGKRLGIVTGKLQN